MRRNTIVLMLAALLAFAGVTFAQDWPDELAGFEFDGDPGEHLFIPWEQKDVPYSFPIDGDLAWLTYIEDTGSDFPRILVEQRCLVHPPYGCVSVPPSGPITAVYPWDYMMQAYAMAWQQPNGDQLLDVYTLKEDGWYHYTGRVNLFPHPPFYYYWQWYYAEHVPIPLPVEHYQPGRKAAE